MPTYEMPLLLRVMAKADVVNTLKRTAELIFKKGGFIRKIENLGQLQTPFKISFNSKTYREANYFILHFDAAPIDLVSINSDCQRDIDIIRARIYNKNEDVTIDCTLHEELLPPAYRPDVKKILEIGKKERAEKEKKKFKFNTGLEYYPFQR